MDRILKQCNPVLGIAFGQTPTAELQLGPRYRSLMIEVSCVNANTFIPNINDVLDLITVKIGGNPQRTHTAWELNEINKSFGAQYGLNAYKTTNGAIAYSNGIPVAPAAGDAGGTIGTTFYLPLFFREPWRNSYAAQEMFAWYTAWQDGSVLPSFTVEMKMPAISANIRAATVPVINLYAETDTAVGPLDNNKKPVAMISKWKRQGLTYGGAGDLVVTNLSKREVYSQISLFSGYSAAAGPAPGKDLDTEIIADQNNLTAFDAITRVKVEVDNRTVRDSSKLINDQSLIDDNMNEAGLPADRFDVVFDKSDLPTDGLVMEANGATVKDLRLTVTVAAQGDGSVVAANKTINALMQQYGAIER